ncbi:family 16 glycosylhydrolase [Cryobacterium tepidiphilum]|nr:family 16 glycosylhydrolase [Cryobacterium tepidiphilum]
MSKSRPRHAQKAAGRTVKGGLPLRRAGISALAIAAVAGAGLTGLAAQAEQPETGKNLVSNGTFASSNAGWTGAKNTRLSSADGRGDDRAVRVTSTSHAASTVALWERRTPVENVVAKHTYRATAWVRVEKLGRSVALRLYEKNHRDHVVGTEQAASKPKSTGWKKITADYTARSNASSLDLGILGYGVDRDRGMVIDDVTLVDVTPASTASAAPTATATAKATAKPTAKPSAKSTSEPTTKPSAKATETPTTAPDVAADAAAQTEAAASQPAPTTSASPAAVAPAKTSSPAAPSGWKLAWSDEFNDTTIDRNAWTVENNSTYGDGNKELACLMDRPENIKESDGLLTISARKESSPITCGSHDSRFPNGRSYTSAMMNTKNKMDFEYGRFEIRAKLPTTPGSSKGLWPAFWMRPTSGSLGELDILEVVGTSKNNASEANKVSQTIHYDYVPTYPMQVNVYKTPSGSYADGFHDFAVEWEPGSIKWYVDGNLTYTRTKDTTSWIDKAFSGDFYLRLNMAVGGSWPGSPDADTAFPAKYQVDYVRVYQR